jgi:hypothetical protein
MKKVFLAIVALALLGYGIWLNIMPDTSSPRAVQSSQVNQSATVNHTDYTNNSFRTASGQFTFGQVSVAPARLLADDNPNQKLLVIAYAYQNNSQEPQRPYTDWSKHMTATQDGQLLQEGALMINESASAFNTLANNAVRFVPSQAKTSAIATFQFHTDVSAPIKVTLRDDNQHVIHTWTYQWQELGG